MCYFNCRATHPCDPSSRANCFRNCDKIFLDEVPISFLNITFDATGLGLWYGIAAHFDPDPEANAPCCKTPKPIFVPPLPKISEPPWPFKLVF
jgi:hypothetical protein